MAGEKNPDPLGRSKQISIERKLWAQNIVNSDRFEFGIQLQKAQALKGYSNREISKLLGISASTVNKWNKGRNPVGGSYILRYCNILGIDKREFSLNILRYFMPQIYIALYPDRASPDLDVIIEASEYLDSLNGHPFL